MASIGSLTADLRLESASFIRDLGRSSKAVATHTAAMRRSIDAVSASARTLNVGLGGFASAALLRKIARVTNESLRLASTIQGPLGDATRAYLKEAEKFGTVFELGVAQGFLDGMNVSINNSADALTRASEAGRIFGQVVGGAFSAVLSLADRFASRMNEIGPKLDNLARLAFDPTLGLMSGAGSARPGLPSLDQNAMLDQLNGTAQSGTDIWNQYAASVANANKQIADTSKVINVAFPDIEKLRQQQFEASIQITQNWLGVADTVGQALGTLFKDNKAVAIAQAVINTAQAITEAMKLPFPVNWAQVAAVTALGAAQIATISSTEPGSSKALTKSSGASSGAAKAGMASTSSGRSGSGSLQQAVTINIEGDSFGPEHFRKLVTGLNAVIADGATLRVG